MNFQIIIKNAGDEVRVQETAEDGDVFLIEAGDQVVVLDENGAPANAELTPKGSDLIVTLPDGGITFTLDEYFSSAGEGSPAHLQLSPETDQTAVYRLLAAYGNGTEPGAGPQQELKPTAALDADSADGSSGGEDFGSGAVGNTPQGDDFTLMRLSNLGYANFGETFTDFGEDLSGALTPDETPPPEGFGGSSPRSNQEPTISDNDTISDDDGFPEDDSAVSESGSSTSHVDSGNRRVRFEQRSGGG